MKRLLAILLFLPLLAIAQQQPNQIQQELAKLAWQDGPSKGVVGANATISIPKGYVFLDGPNTRKFLELNGNPPQDNNYTIAPNTLQWFAIFQFAPTGYIKDDEKIDPDELLKKLKESDISNNEERKRLNMPAIYTDGWASSPHYDIQTKRLEWGTQLHSADGMKNVNYTSRILGRTGVMSVILVADPDTLDQDIREFKQTLSGFTYNPGQAYTEFKKGDKVAEYGLAALILGGAAAVATKKGFWAMLVGAVAAFWKLIVGVVIAGLAGITRIFKKKS
ncbi:DUF2167 domain-containing protein [Candidimonas humi]|uniref:DUF2167 domain-containing protein n=1 Tax=Candidimonas humi TaxID=683355 RepID=A0ABV8NY47_9BURK|nr:DUF2167 domain-containing protein [Candidimonas humi]MBV6305684.1 DUF2167 domain-containing protein [Candidimonas humi]